MEVLIYDGLKAGQAKKQLEKVLNALKAGDFRTADVKKMPNTGYYRAKLDDKNRLLFKFSRYEGRTYILALEVILNHAYDKSRFLGGAPVDEQRLQPIANEHELEAESLQPLAYVNPKAKKFRLLDKILSFDEAQEEIFSFSLPLIIIGSAGSGKTALTLEKMKTLRGRLLYVTLSPYLAEHSRHLYYSFGYDNQHQEVDFLSFQEFLQTIEVPQGREINYRIFEGWLSRFKQAYKIRDAHKVFEEFKGVITGSVVDKPYLSREEYLNLGVRRSVFTEGERGPIYELFLKYLDFLKENSYYDSNMVAFSYLSRIQEEYDFVVVDEVQDITNIQLQLILQTLSKPGQFILCGDSNQIVHPNFFSWANVKTMFYRQGMQGDIMRILATNYRNTAEVTHIANRLLLVKNARFGSIDKESTYLVQPNSKQEGAVEFLEDQPKLKQELDRKTGKSARYAVLVTRNEDKAEARKFFRTPLLFSIQEAKGLEYENIILYNIISDNEKEFREICSGVSPEDLKGELVYARARDKSDKSLEAYKFYINSLYVAITRAVKNLYVIERNKKHQLLSLLELADFKNKVGIGDQSSSMEEWQREARRLELQGKQEQADDIRSMILKTQPVPWEVITLKKLGELRTEALDPGRFNKKAKDTLYEYALFYDDDATFHALAELNYKRAADWKKDGADYLRRLLNDYLKDNVRPIQQEVKRYGPDFRNKSNLTPLMLAATTGAAEIITFLAEVGADPELLDNYGRNAFRIALLNAFRDPGFAAEKLPAIYRLLEPDSIKVRVDGKMIKISTNQAEFWMFNLTLAITRELFVHKAKQDMPSVESADFLSAAENYPLHILPEYRRKRPYISSILSKNEVNRDDKYNKKLFVRVRHGYYLPNPLLEVLVGEDWINVYELLSIDAIKADANRRAGYWLRLLETYREMAATGRKTDMELAWIRVALEEDYVSPGYRQEAQRRLKEWEAQKVPTIP